MIVSMNMAMSLDGKIATAARGPVKLGSAYDSERMGEIRALHDLVLMGARTFAAYPKPLQVKSKKLVAKRMRQGKTPQPATGIVSSRLAIPANTPWEKSADLRLAFCGAKATAKTIARLRGKGVYVMRSTKLRPSAKEIIKTASGLGFRRILLEGGGELNAAFFEAGLVDQLFITLCPILIGGTEAPSFFEGKGFAKGKFAGFRLKRCRRRGQELYLEYSKS